MAYWGSFTRVNIIAIFLLSSLLFSSIANSSYESLAFSSNIESTNYLDYNENEKLVQTKSVQHSISLSESMNLSSPNEKNNLPKNHINEVQNIKSIFFEEELIFSSDSYQQQTAVILTKQFSDRKAIIERISPFDRIRNQEKSSHKNYLDTGVQLVFLDNNQKIIKQDYQTNFISDSIFDENFNNYLFNSLTISPNDSFVHYFELQQFLDSINFISDLQLSNILFNQINTNEPTGIIILFLISGLIFIRNENEHIQFHSYKKLFSYVVIILLFSSAIITPASISSSYWGTAFGQEMNNTEIDFLDDHQTTPPADSINNTFTGNLNSQNVDDFIVLNSTELLPENYTAPISNSTELLPENYTAPISNSTELLPENYTAP
ncbi:MAG TPA: hypothetical protein VD731_00005, partial [Nitrosopumilaceae archaeon]|nr:hypothetical protein [Nitrosopumilaceae archaeon]